MPETRARISTCRELSVWASHSNVIGTSRGSIFTVVTSTGWGVATLVYSFLQPTTKSTHASTNTSAPANGLGEIGFILESSLSVSFGRILGETLETTMLTNGKKPSV